MSRTLLTVFTAVSALFMQAASAAPIIAQDNFVAGWATDTGGIGQTFVWPADVPLGIARVVASESPFTATFKLYNGVHTCDDSGGEFYSQTNIALALNVFTTIVLTAPQALAINSTYTFCVYNTTGGRLALNYTSLYSFYPDGTYVSDDTIDPAGGGGDLQFELDVPPGSVVVAAVPTLHAASAVALALLILGMGMLARQTRKQAAWMK